MAPDYFPAALGIAAAMVVLLAPALYMVGRLSDATGQPRIVAASAIAGVVIVIGVGGTPEIIQLWSWFTVSGSLPPSILGEKSAVVQETQPTGINDFAASFGTMGLLGLAAIPASLWSLSKGGGQAQRVLCSVSGSLVILLWLKTNDYGYLVAPMACLLASVTLEIILDWSGQARFRTRVIGIVLWLAVLVPLFPLGRVRGPTPDSTTLSRMMILDDTWKDAMDWVKEHTPTPTLGVDEAVHRPESGDTTYPAGTYGVWAAWDYGSFVSSLGERPVTRSQGPKAANSRWLFHQNESESIRHLNQGASGDEQVRYVIVDAATMAQNYPAHVIVAGKSPASVVGPVENLPTQRGTTILPTYGRQDRTAIASRLFFYDGNGLHQYRLVYSSPRRSLIAYFRQESQHPGSLVFHRRAFPDRALGGSADPGDLYARLLQAESPTYVEDLGLAYGAIVRPSLQIFEVVRGVTIAGTGTDEAHVRVSIPLRTYPDRRDILFRAVGQIGSDDRFTVTVPYSTERGSRVRSRASVTATAECLVELLRSNATKAQRSWTLEISEAQVQSGETIEVR